MGSIVLTIGIIGRLMIFGLLIIDFILLITILTGILDTKGSISIMLGGMGILFMDGIIIIHTITLSQTKIVMEERSLTIEVL